MAAMSTRLLPSFFADEPKSINQGENNYNTNILNCLNILIGSLIFHYSEGNKNVREAK